MNGRARSFNALESSNGNWIIGPSIPQQDLYDIPKSSRQKRIPTGNTLHGKSRSHLSETRAESTTLSKAAHESYLKRDGHRGRETRRLKGNNRRSHSVERTSTSTSTTNSSGYISSRENLGKLVPREVILHKSDGDFGFSMRQISSTMYGGKPVSAFRPTAKMPALQRLNCIDPGSLADRVGLKPGDYIIEVNNQCVTCSPHQYVVHLITSSPDALKLKVVEGSEDDFQTPYNATLPQHNSTARNAANGKSHSTSSVPRSSHETEPPRNKRSNGLPLQQLRVNTDVNQPLHKTTLAPPHQISNGLSSTEKHRLPTTKPAEPVVANIRLSRVMAHDQVFYESGRKPKPVSVSSQPRTATSDLQRSPSFTSTVTIASEPQKHDARHVAFAGDTILRNHPRKTTGSLQGELRTVHEQELAVHWSGSSSDDMNPTYDRIRPITVPFDTDEGYIRLSTNVDYVAQAHKEQEQEQVDFLAMAEKARQVYILRTKAASQTQ